MFSCCFRREPTPANAPTSSLKQSLLQNSRISLDSPSLEDLAQLPRNGEVKKVSLSFVNPQLEKMQLFSSVFNCGQPAVQTNIQKIDSKMASAGPKSEADRNQKECYTADQKEQSNQSLQTSTSEKQERRQRSQLWEVESGTKIIYLNEKKQEQMVFVFKIKHLKTTQVSPIGYVLNPHARSGNINHGDKLQAVSLDFMFWNKSVADLHSMLRLSQKSWNIRPIFGVSKAAENAGKPHKAYYDVFEPEELIMIGSQCLRLEVFDRIAICCLNEQRFEAILEFSAGIAASLQRDDMVKTIFLLPSHLTLSQISSILAKVFSRFVVSEKLQSILQLIGFQIELVQSSQLEYFIVRNNFSQVEEGEVARKQYEIKLQLILGILMMQINERNFKAYEQMVKSFLSDLTISKYFKLISFLHADPATSVKRIEQLKIFDSSMLWQIEKSDRIKVDIISPSERMIFLRKKMKRRFGELLADYKSAQTPVEEAESSKKDWDDELSESDLIAERTSKYYNEDSNKEDECNIFETIGDEEIQASNLDILSGLQLREIEEQ